LRRYFDTGYRKAAESQLLYLKGRRCLNEAVARGERAESIGQGPEAVEKDVSPTRHLNPKPFANEEANAAFGDHHLDSLFHFLIIHTEQSVQVEAFFLHSAYGNREKRSDTCVVLISLSKVRVDIKEEKVGKEVMP
jgi:hypothetical protein